MRNAPTQERSVTEAMVAICGNPNCGKTTIFNAITGLRQRVANYPGVTVERTVGLFTMGSAQPFLFSLVDIPGTYSLAAFSPDEYIAAQALFGSHKDESKPDVVVCVIDATNLERGLYLLFQVLEIGMPVVVALNMVDLATRRGLRVDVRTLSERLGGVRVIPVVGCKGEGIAELKDAILQTADEPRCVRQSFYHPIVTDIADSLAYTNRGSVRSRAEYLRILLDENGVAERDFLKNATSDERELLDRTRRDFASQFGTLSGAETQTLTVAASRLFSEVVQRVQETKRTKSEKIDRYLLHPILGPALLVIMMTLIFQSIFSWAEPVMHLIDATFSSLGGEVSGLMPDGPLRSLLVDGIIGGVGSVLVFLPQITILFLFIGMLEDSGYMPRVAFLVDRAFSWCGLSGKSFIPMLSSFACAVPGIMATRTIEDRKHRFMTILVAPLMTCSARLPVYAIMIAAFIPHKTYMGILNSHGLLLGGLYLLGVIVAVLVSLVMSKVVFKSQRGTFLMELPSYKIPTLRSVLIRVYHRVRSFVFRAGTVILAITVIIWALSYYPRSDKLAGTTPGTIAGSSEGTRAGEQLGDSYLGQLGHVVEPLFAPLGWDWKITMATLASFPAREVIIATLGTIYNLGAEGHDSSESLVDKMRLAKWEQGPKAGLAVFNPAVALSIMVFFALCCQCGATVVTIRQETGSWKYAAGTFLYMTLLAYGAALIVYQTAIRMEAV